MQDTAAVYRNEHFIGHVLKDLFNSGKIKREQVFITSKLSPKDLGYEKTIKAVENSLGNLQLEFIDLYLIHWPAATGLEPSSPKNAGLRKESWRALEEMHSKGRLRYIGVSNYLKTHLQELLSYAHIKPFLNQFELHPLCVDSDLINFCKENNIRIQAYASLGEGNLMELLQADLKALSSLHSVTPAMILLKWALQHSFMIIPKTVSTSRIILENSPSALNSFNLTVEQMNFIDSLQYKRSKMRFCWDPSGVA